MPREKSRRPLQRIADNQAARYAETRAQIAKEKLALLDIVEEVRELRKTRGRSHAFKIAAYAKELPGRVKHIKELAQDAGRQGAVLRRLSKNPVEEYSEAVDRAIEDLEHSDPEDMLEAYEELKKSPSLTVDTSDLPEALGAAREAEPGETLEAPANQGLGVIVGGLGLLWWFLKGKK